MKRYTVHISLCLVLCLLAAAGEARAQAGKAKQRMPNGGFEKGLAGWKAGKSHQIVEDPAQAHGGLRCLLGEVTRRTKGQVLRRSIKLKKDKLYRLSLWARADNGSRLMVWIRTGGKKQVIGNWHRVGRKWRRYRANFTVEEDGKVAFGIVAPSSAAAPIGRMWIDDVSLAERPLWPQVNISKDEGFNDFPRMIKSGPDSAWAAWISFRHGHDTLQAARLMRRKKTMEVEKQWEIEKNARILHPDLAPAGTGAWLTYAREDGVNWDLFAVELKDDGPQKPLRITGSPGVDVKPAAAFYQDTLWIAWETNRDGRRQVYLTAVRDGQVGTPRLLSKTGTNNYSPSIAAAEDGRIWVVWHSFRENNFDLYGRRLEGGNLGPE